MSGTSCDGLDLALLDFGPGDQWSVVRGGEVVFPVELRSRLLAASQAEAKELGRLNFDFMHWCADEVLTFLGGESIDLVVSHGQTIFHEPPRATWQLGDGNVLAARLALPVLWNLRSADVAVGGEGAPLVPVPDRFFFEPTSGARWLLNIGGIANLTGLDSEGSGWAGDVGPGNCLIDRFVASRSGGSLQMDRDGEVSRSGVVDKDLLERLLQAVRPHLGASLARETFSAEWLSDLMPSSVGTGDGARTLVALSVELIATALDANPLVTDELFVAGGGAHNATLMAALQARLPRFEVAPFERLGMSGDLREAACFAALGWLFLQGESGADHRITRAKTAQRLGSLALPSVVCTTVT
jgi:anhydro-N-acetylmuramic acid kinase